LCFWIEIHKNIPFILVVLELLLIVKIGYGGLEMRQRAKTVTHRGQSAPPENLARFIEWANFFRREAAMPEQDRVSPLFILATMRDRRTQDELMERMGTIPGFSQEVLPHVLERWKKSPTFETRVWASQLAELERASQTLEDIAARNRRGTDEKPSFIQCKARLVVDASGRLALRDTLLDALIGVPAERIKICAICDAIFWAPRVNSECCNTRCRKIYNQRNSRAARRDLRRKGR
jgi:hypothetical protein